MCGGKGLFQVEDLPVGPRWFCTEKHFAEYAGLPVKESGYYGFEAEGELERNYFTRFGDKRGGKEWGEYTFSWHNSVGEWKPISEDTAGWDEDDYEGFQDEKEYELVHDMLSDSNSELYKLIQNNSWGEEGHELNTNYEVLNEHGEKEHLSLSISWGEPEIEQQKIQYYDKEPLYRLEFLAESFEATEYKKICEGQGPHLHGKSCKNCWPTDKKNPMSGCECSPQEIAEKVAKAPYHYGKEPYTIHHRRDYSTITCEDCGNSWRQPDYEHSYSGPSLEPEDYYPLTEMWYQETNEEPAWLQAEFKKLPPVEKAIDTGIASGATMEGLETLMAAEGDYEPSFDSLQERIEWMEFAVGDKNWRMYEEDYSDVVLDIEEWNENNENNSKLSNLVKRYKKRTGWMDAESFSSKLARYGDGKRVINKKTQNKGVMKVTERKVMRGGIDWGIKTSYEVYYDKGTHYYTDNFTTLIRNFTPLDDEKNAESFSANPQGRPKCVKCNHRYGQGTCAACGNILCERCHGDGEWCKSCPPKCDWCNTPAHSCPDSPSCDNSLCDECCKDYAAESFSADGQKACHRCGNTEKDGKLWWVGSRKGFICGGCSDDGKKYRADGENSSLPQAYLMENWEKKHPYEIHVAGCNHGNLVGGDSEHRVFGEASSSIKNVCNEYIDMWTYNFESMPKEWKPSDAEIDAINNMTFSQFMRNKYVKDTVPVKLSPCCKKDVRIKEYCDNALIKDIQTVTPFNAESFNATSKGFDGGFRCGDCDKTYLYHNDAKHGGCEKARRWYDEDVGESCDCMEDAEQSAEYCCMEAESYSAEDKSCECGREGSTKFCEWCRYDKCEKCFQEMKDECRHCEGQDKTPDGKWCEYCDGGEKYICHENNIPEFDWAVMEPEHPYDTTKEEMGYAAESDELEESKKRTKMSMIRTGLAITTFGIVIWNLWTNKKQEKDISDIMDLI